jgi:hypothetical protein
MNITALEAAGQTGAPIFDEFDLNAGVPAPKMSQEAGEQSYMAYASMLGRKPQ